MSLITQQLILQAKSDRADVLHRLSVGEDTQKLRDLLNITTKRLAKLEKELNSERAKGEADRKAAEEKAERMTAKKHTSPPMKKYADLPEDLELPCVDCGSSFPFTGKDQVFFEKQGWSDPSRCSFCRDAKKNAKPTGKELTCGGCSEVFFFSDGKARIFEEKGWAEPKRCQDCRAKKNTQKV